MLRALGLLVGGVLVTATLSGCSGSDDEPGATTTTSSSTASASMATPTPSSYLPAPEGVTLTEPGTEVPLGSPATIAWQPRQSLVGVLDVTVTSLASTTFKESFQGWQIDEATRAKSPYLVTATNHNARDTHLGGRPVPLYAATSANTLVEPSTFSQEFRPCRPGSLPAPFPPGGTVDVCLVYLLPEGGTLTGVSFRPTEEFDPITWTGKVLTLEQAKKAAQRAARRAGSGGTPSPTASPTGSPTASPTGSATGSPSPSAS